MMNMTQKVESTKINQELAKPKTQTMTECRHFNPKYNLFLNLTK